MRPISIQLLGILAVALSFFLLPSASALGATYYVPDDFGTIQAALDGASEGDEIIVREGEDFGQPGLNIVYAGQIWRFCKL